MTRIAKSAMELEQIALAAIHRCPGCKGVRRVIVSRIMDDRADYNWSIAIADMGDVDTSYARRVALNVHEELSAQYDLAQLSPGNAVIGSWRLPT
jgi:hypothetical protein